MKEKSENNEIVKQAQAEGRKGQDQSSGVNESRRSLTKAGFAMPALITLASRPVLGGQCTHSVLASGNLSNPVDWSDCGGCTPGYWGSAPGAAPGGIYRGTTYSTGDIFNAIFGYPKILGPFSKAVSPFASTDTLAIVVDNGNGNGPNSDPNGNPIAALKNSSNEDVEIPNEQNYQKALAQLGRSAVAALLNATNQTTSYVLWPQDVIDNFQAAFDAFITGLTTDQDGQINPDSVDKSGLTSLNTLLDSYNNAGSCPLPGNDLWKNP